MYRADTILFRSWLSTHSLLYVGCLQMFLGLDETKTSLIWGMFDDLSMFFQGFGGYTIVLQQYLTL